VIGVPLFSPRMTPVCAPAVARRLKRPADLYKVPLLDVEHAPADWTLWLQTAKLDPARVDRRNSFPFYSFALQAAVDGLGVAIGLHPYVIDDLKAQRLVAPFELSVTKPEGWYLHYRKDSEGNAAFAKFQKWLRAEARAE